MYQRKCVAHFNARGLFCKICFTVPDEWAENQSTCKGCHKNTKIHWSKKDSLCTVTGCPWHVLTIIVIKMLKVPVIYVEENLSDWCFYSKVTSSWVLLFAVLFWFLWNWGTCRWSRPQGGADGWDPISMARFGLPSVLLILVSISPMIKVFLFSRLLSLSACLLAVNLMQQQ